MPWSWAAQTFARGVTRYAVVMIPHIGADAMAWWCTSVDLGALRLSRRTAHRAALAGRGPGSSGSASSCAVVCTSAKRSASAARATR
jgi:hypothetical protein